MQTDSKHYVAFKFLLHLFYHDGVRMLTISNQTILVNVGYQQQPRKYFLSENLLKRLAWNEILHLL